MKLQYWTMSDDEEMILSIVASSIMVQLHEMYKIGTIVKIGLVSNYGCKIELGPIGILIRRVFH